MRLPTCQRPRTLSLNLTPLVDVVFLLIVFFLVSSHLAHRELRRDVDLPTAATGERTPPGPPRVVAINVLADGTIELAGQATPIAEVPAWIAAYRERRPEPFEVHVRGDRATDFATIEPVLAACARAGVGRIGFAVVERREGP